MQQREETKQPATAGSVASNAPTPAVSLTSLVPKAFEKVPLPPQPGKLTLTLEIVDRLMWTRYDAPKPTYIPFSGATSLSLDPDQFLQHSGHWTHLQLEEPHLTGWINERLADEHLDQESRAMLQNAFTTVWVQTVPDPTHMERVLPSMAKLGSYLRFSDPLPQEIKGRLFLKHGLGQKQREYLKRSTCWCKEPEYGQMASCADKSCVHEVFHLDCEGLVENPGSWWRCFSCRGNDLEGWE